MLGLKLIQLTEIPHDGFFVGKTQEQSLCVFVYTYIS